MNEQQIHNREVWSNVFEHIFCPLELFQHWKAYSLCGRSDVAIVSCHLCMDGWLLRKHSLAFTQASPLPCVGSTEMDICRWQFIIVAIERVSAILWKDDSRDSGRWNGETGSKTISGRPRGRNLRTCLLDYGMHLSDDYYHTRYSSYCLSQHS